MFIHPAIGLLFRHPFLALLFLLAVVPLPAAAVELPAPEVLGKEAGISSTPVEVVEPHLAGGGREAHIVYSGWPLPPLLDRWFGSAWREPGARVTFLARDGYRSVIAGAKLAAAPAFLSFGRADGAPFMLFNGEQNERVALGPYYLVWDNLKQPALRAEGSVGWPYQVTRVELLAADAAMAPLPAGADAEAMAGRDAAESYCLACHHLQGVGGRKYPEDLSAAVCRWTDDELLRWIDDPAKLRPGTTMPGLSRTWSEERRRQVAGRIVHYLRAVRSAAPDSCPSNTQ